MARLTQLGSGYDHQRRELLVPAFVVKAIRRYLATVPDGPEVFVFPGRQRRHYARPIDGRDAQVAKHLDKLGTPRAPGTQRARKPRKKGS